MLAADDCGGGTGRRAALTLPSGVDDTVMGATTAGVSEVVRSDGTREDCTLARSGEDDPGGVTSTSSLVDGLSVGDSATGSMRLDVCVGFLSSVDANSPRTGGAGNVKLPPTAAGDGSGAPAANTAT